MGRIARECQTPSLQYEHKQTNKGKKMTRKDYKIVAEVLSGFQHMDPQMFSDLVESFAVAFESDNDRFDGVKFSAACDGE